MKVNAHVDLKLRNNPEYVTVAQYLGQGDAINAAIDWKLGPDVEGIRVMVREETTIAKWVCAYEVYGIAPTAEEAAPVQ